MLVPGLPDGLHARPLTVDDASAVVALVRADELEVLGESYLDLSEVIAHWQRPSFRLAEQSVGIFDADGSLLGSGEVAAGRRAEVVVAPMHRSRGIGTALMRWTWSQALTDGGHLVGQTVPVAHREAVALLKAHGYQHRWTAWILRLAPETTIEPQPLPVGFALREFVPGRDEEVTFRTIDDAFNEWPDRTPSSLADWAATAYGRDDFEPWQVQLAVDGDKVVGACHVVILSGAGWVNEVAVRSDYRGRGLAKALLARAFAETRARGARTAELSTDSRTGALELYLHVGMHITAEFVQLAKELGGDG